MSSFLSLATIPLISAWSPVPLQLEALDVQPMTGIVLWTDHPQASSQDVALEYSYMSFADVSPSRGTWNWKPVDDLLAAVARRKHQAILRFRYEYVGEPTTVPAWIRATSGYAETKGVSEGQETWFSDWRSQDLMDFTMDFHRAFAARYLDDPRLAFVQVGFGLWAEYHIYDGPMVLGRTFPSKAFQARFLRHLDTLYTRLPWSLSIDAANDWAPFDSVPALKSLGFGLFDDSFLHKTHDQENRPNWLFFGADRADSRPAGGELSYFTAFDQGHALDSAGLHGRTFESQASRYAISYMIGNDQPGFHTWARIREAGRACGYRFEAASWQASPDSFRLVVSNAGVAPLYRDAWLHVGSDTSRASLRGLRPGDTLVATFPRRRRDLSTRPAIACGHCVPGRGIQLAASLPSTSTAIADRIPTGTRTSLRTRLVEGRLHYWSDHPVSVRIRRIDGSIRGVLALSSTEGRWEPVPGAALGDSLEIILR